MSINDFLLSEGENLQLIIFFGGLGVFALLETILPAEKSIVRRMIRWKANFGITLLNFAVLSALPISIIATASWANAERFGLLNWVELPWSIVFIATILCRSWLSYIVHVGMHKIPLLWRLHRIHHTDLHLDVSTTVRMHPFEFIIGWVILLPSTLLLGLSPWVLIIYELLDVFITLFSHSNISLPVWIDKCVRVIFVTPNMHKIHHSPNQLETDSNYGAVFSFWDRLFGTYRTNSLTSDEGAKFGLEEPRDQRVYHVSWLLSSPFKK